MNDCTGALNNWINHMMAVRVLTLEKDNKFNHLPPMNSWYRWWSKSLIVKEEVVAPRAVPHSIGKSSPGEFHRHESHKLFPLSCGFLIGYGKLLSAKNERVDSVLFFSFLHLFLSCLSSNCLIRVEFERKDWQIFFESVQLFYDQFNKSILQIIKNLLVNVEEY
jgi:hypothetical protein